MLFPGPLVLALNHLLAQAAWARDRLKPFAGRSAQIVMAPLAAAFRVADDGTVTTAGTDVTSEGRPDVSISLPLISPLLLLQGPAVLMQAARIEGSAEFAEALGFVLRNLRWDVEEDLSKVVGDIAAHRIFNGVRQFGSEQETAARNLAENLVEYFVEEQPMIARREDVEDFAQGVAALRDDLARLEKRVGRVDRATLATQEPAAIVARRIETA